jgi:hypothetical protein
MQRSHHNSDLKVTVVCQCQKPPPTPKKNKPFLKTLDSATCQCALNSYRVEMECPLNSFTLHVMVFETLLKSKDSYIQEKSAKGFKMKITSDSSAAMRACKAARSLRSREGMSRAPSSWNLFHISDSEGAPSPPFRPAEMMVGGSTRARASSPPAATLLLMFVGDPLFPLSLAIVRSKGCLLCGGDPRLP